MTRQIIFDEINAEREHQINRWGNATKDKAQNNFNDWVSYISRYSTTWFPGDFPPYSEETKAAFRKSMIKVAALAVAAIEALES